MVTVADIFATIYNYRAHNYFITIVMKFRNYFPSSSDNSQCDKFMVKNVPPMTNNFWKIIMLKAHTGECNADL